MRGLKEQQPPLVCDEHGNSATNTKESAKNFRDRWAEVSKDSAHGTDAEEWQHSYQQACDNLKAKW